MVKQKKKSKTSKKRIVNKVKKRIKKQNKEQGLTIAEQNRLAKAARQVLSEQRGQRQNARNRNNNVQLERQIEQAVEQINDQNRAGEPRNNYLTRQERIDDANELYNSRWWRETFPKYLNKDYNRRGAVCFTKVYRTYRRRYPCRRNN